MTLSIHAAFRAAALGQLDGPVSVKHAGFKISASQTAGKQKQQQRAGGKGNCFVSAAGQ